MAKSGSQFQPGTRIREYEILEIVGRGGMGAVYKAQHVYLHKIRAIKVIHAVLSGNDEVVARFVREARILCELNHPNLVRLHEFGTLDDGSFFMAMEFVQGESLLQRIRQKGKLDLDESLRIVHDAAMGLHSAHQMGIVHRDISPDNIMLVRDASEKEITKIIDFGIAKPLQEGQGFTATQMFIGKPEYCSPEQTGVLPEGAMIDHRSDIYSLAITFYKMLCGSLPFSSTTPQGYLVKHATEPPKSILAYLPVSEVNQSLDQVIQKALAKDREKRFRSMEEFANALDLVQREQKGVEQSRIQQDPQQSFQEFFRRGKELFDQVQYEEAIRWWDKSLMLYDDPTVRQWITVARERLNTEHEIRTQLVKDLNECETLLYQTNFSAAGQLLSRIENSLPAGHRLEDLQQKVVTLRQKVETGRAPTPTMKQTGGSIKLWLILGAVFLIGVISAAVFFFVAYEIRVQQKTERQQQLVREATGLLESGRIRQARDTIEQIRSLNLPNTDDILHDFAESERSKIESLRRINATDASGQTELMRQIIRQNAEKASALIKQGADVNKSDSTDTSILMYAAWKTPELVDELIRAGADYNFQNNQKITPLLVASDVGQIQSVEALIRAGADLNAQNSHGTTPLIFAAMGGHSRIARMLIDAGANLTITTPDGYNALKTANIYKHPDIVEMLTDALNQTAKR